MERTERFYTIERLIRSRGRVTFAALRDALEVSPATLKRDLQYLRDRMGAPIEYDRELGAYRFSQSPATRHELPGLWFSEPELYSLLTAHQLLSGLDADGTLSRHLQPLLERIHTLLGATEGGPQWLLQRIRIVTAVRRPVPGKFFERVTEALLKRQRIHLHYYTRKRRQTSEREVSPQRLTHYKNTWYLDAWCHTTGALRRFALDAIETAEVLSSGAQEVPLRDIETEFDNGYGAFAGARVQWATLIFEAEAAEWVSREEWHPKQETQWLPDGRFEMRVPYADSTEICMDVLRHHALVQVVTPASLRDLVRTRLAAALARATE